jgi:Predicted membrane protein (DUF2142)
MARGPLTTRPASGEGEPSAPPEISRATYRRRWLVTFVLLVALATAWSLVTPPGGGPDEPAHAIKAAAVAGGELTGDPYPPVGGGALVVEAPASLDALDPTCFAFQAGISASCRPSYEGPDGDEEIVTTAGVSPPAYYAIVGGPLHLVPSLDGLYLARLIGGVVAAALVATAVQLAAAARSRFLVVAVAVSWTPMAASLTGVVNPSSLELSAGVLVWVSGLLLVRPHPLPPWLERRLIWHFAAASALFVLSRQLSPLLLACIVGAVALAAPLARLRELVADRRTWVAAGVVGVASLFAAWWLVANPVKEDATVAATAVSGRHALSTSFGYFGTLYEQMIGIFGWLDARPPAGVVLSWTVAIGVLVVLGAAVGSRRLVLALAAVTAVSVVLPGLLAASQMEEHGILFQGRYILPLGAGIVVLAGRAVDEAGHELVDRLSRSHRGRPPRGDLVRGPALRGRRGGTRVLRAGGVDARHLAGGAAGHGLRRRAGLRLVVLADVAGGCVVLRSRRRYLGRDAHRGPRLGGARSRCADRPQRRHRRPGDGRRQPGAGRSVIRRGAANRA